MTWGQSLTAWSRNGPPAVPGIRAQQIDAPATGGVEQSIDDLKRREIHFKRPGIGDPDGGIDKGRVGNEQQVISVRSRQSG